VDNNNQIVEVKIPLDGVEVERVVTPPQPQAAYRNPEFGLYADVRKKMR
jgi:hypothetical protein